MKKHYLPRQISWHSINHVSSEELLTFCSVINSNLSKKMSSHFTRQIQDNIAPPSPLAFFSAGAHAGAPWMDFLDPPLVMYQHQKHFNDINKIQ